MPRTKKRQIKALSVRQPWASLIASGEKTIEVRSWPTNHRGPLLICATKLPREPPCGCMVALVDVASCRPMVKADEHTALSHYEPGQFAWILQNARPVPNHPVSGKLRLFHCDLPPDVAKLL